MSERIPIEQPRVDLTAMRRDLIEKTAARWRQTSQYQIRRLATSGIASVIALVTHSAGETIAGYALSEAAPKVAASFIEKPRVMEWLARPSVEDIAALNTVPHIDRVRIMDALTQTAIGEAKAGRAVKMSPETMAFLGKARAAAIMAATAPKTAGEARNRMKATQGQAPSAATQ
jgi:hypothetical protein